MISKLFNRNVCILKAPMTGTLVPLEQVPDEVFSKKMLGDGIALQPTDGLVVSPVKGKVIQIFPTSHALGILSDEGLEILIHLGIDTVELKGEGFTRLAQPEDVVEPGTPLVKMDLDLIAARGKSTISPVIITNGEKVTELTVMSGIVKAASDDILKIRYIR